MGDYSMEPDKLQWAHPNPCTGDQLVEAYRLGQLDLPAFILIGSTHYSPDDSSRNLEIPSILRLDSVQEQKRFSLLDSHGRVVSVVEDCPVQWTIKESKSSWIKKRKTLLQINAKKYKPPVEISGGEMWQKYLKKLKLTFEPPINDSVQINELKGQRFFKGNFISNGFLEKEPSFIPVDLPLQIRIACGFKAPNSEDEWKKVSEMYNLACFTTAIMYKDTKPNDVFILLSGAPARTLADLRSSADQSERLVRDPNSLFVTADGNMIDGSTLTDYDHDTFVDTSDGEAATAAAAAAAAATAGAATAADVITKQQQQQESEQKQLQNRKNQEYHEQQEEKQRQRQQLKQQQQKEKQRQQQLQQQQQEEKQRQQQQLQQQQEREQSRQFQLLRDQEKQRDQLQRDQQQQRDQLKLDQQQQLLRDQQQLLQDDVRDEYERDDDNVSDEIRIKQQAASIVTAEQKQLLIKQQKQRSDRAQQQQQQHHQPSKALHNGERTNGVQSHSRDKSSSPVPNVLNSSALITTDDEMISSESQQPINRYPVNRSEFRGHEVTYKNASAREVEYIPSRGHQASRYMESDDTDGGMNWESIGHATQSRRHDTEDAVQSGSRGYVEDHDVSPPVPQAYKDSHVSESISRGYRNAQATQTASRDYPDDHVTQTTPRDYQNDPLQDDRDVEFQMAVRQDRVKRTRSEPKPHNNRNRQDDLDLEHDLDRMHVDERYVASAQVRNGTTSNMDRRSRGYIYVEDNSDVWQNQRKSAGRPESVEIRARASTSSAGGWADGRRHSSKRIYQDAAMDSDGGVHSPSNSTYLKWPTTNNRSSREGSTAYYIEENQTSNQAAFPDVQLRSYKPASQVGGPAPPTMRHTMELNPPTSRRTSSISGYSTVPHSYKYLSDSAAGHAAYYQQQRQQQRRHRQQQLQQQQLQQILEHDANNNVDFSVVRPRGGPKIQCLTTDVNGHGFQNYSVRNSNPPLIRRSDTNQAYVVQRSHSAVPSSVIGRSGPYMRAVPVMQNQQFESVQVPANIFVPVNPGSRSYGSLSRATGRKVYASPFDRDMEVIHVTNPQRPSSIMGAPQVGSRIYVHH